MTRSHKTLADLKKGQKAIIKGFTQASQALFRIREMGLTHGEEVTLNKVAPFGDPYELIVRDYRLSIRKKEAGNIIIES